MGFHPSRMPWPSITDPFPAAAPSAPQANATSASQGMFYHSPPLRWLQIIA
jgi:hypothetical protein